MTIGQQEPLELRGSWFRTKYYIEDNRILPIPGTKVEGYNPFDYYESENAGIIDTSLHIKFANWDFSNSRNIEDFCNNWGILGLGYRRLLGPYHQQNNTSNYSFINEKLFPQEKSGTIARTIQLHEYAEPIELFLHEAQQYKWAMMAGHALRENNIDMQRSLLETATGEDFSGKPEVVIREELYVRFLQLINSYLQYVKLKLNGMFDRKGPINHFFLQWRFPSLLDCFYIMLSLDFQKGRYIRVCKSTTCQKIFATDRQDKLYCSRECAMRQADRDYKAKKKAEKEGSKTSFS
jgi:hypothetical protein